MVNCRSITKRLCKKLSILIYELMRQSKPKKRHMNAKPTFFFTVLQHKLLFFNLKKNIKILGSKKYNVYPLKHF